MGENIKVSIIIPVYSVEKYLSECIESIVNQTYLFKEIILVDDGSIDNSSDICDDYASRYSYIKVIHKVNGGLSDARNQGIENATGEYVAFLDGDDFWNTKDALEQLVRRLYKTEADVLNFSFAKYYEKTNEKKSYFLKKQSMPLDLKKKKEQLDYLTKNHLYISSACNKLIRRELLDENLMFEKDTYSEDVEWSAKLLKKARSMDFVFMNVLCYRQRIDSISHTINDKKCNDLCKHIIKCIEMLQEVDDEIKNALRKYAAYQFGTYFIVQAQAANYQKENIAKLSKYQEILKYHQGRMKLLVLHIGCKICGYERLCKIVRDGYQHRKLGK